MSSCCNAFDYSRSGDTAEVHAPGSVPTTVGAVNPNGSLVHTETGAVIEWIQVRADGSQVFYYYDAAGDLQSAIAAEVSQIPPAAVPQYVGDYKFEIFQLASVTEMTSADILDQAIADGVTIYSPDGSRPLSVGDIISSIDIDVKPIGGGFGDLDSGVEAVSSEAVVIAGERSQNLDGGASSSFGGLSSGGFLVPSNFSELEVSAGSVVEVSVTFASVPV